MVIQRVGPMSCAKIAGTLYGAVGLAIGAVVSVIAFAGGFTPDTTSGLAFGAFFGAAAIVLIPICYGGLAFVGALIGAALYNVLTRLVGGVEIEVT